MEFKYCERHRQYSRRKLQRRIKEIILPHTHPPSRVNQDPKNDHHIREVPKVSFDDSDDQGSNQRQTKSLTFKQIVDVSESEGDDELEMGLHYRHEREDSPDRHTTCTKDPKHRKNAFMSPMMKQRLIHPHRLSVMSVMPHHQMKTTLHRIPLTHQQMRECLRDIRTTFHRDRRQYDCYIGMDLSIHNPGIVCRVDFPDWVDPHYHIFAFGKRGKGDNEATATAVSEATDDSKNDNKNDNKNDGVPYTFHFIKKKPRKHQYKYDIDWYEDVMKVMLHNVEKEVIFRYHIPRDQVYVVIENYAFRKKDTSSLTKLCESTALMKRMLRKRKRKYPFQLYSNTMVKKHWSGRGDAKKDQMWEAFARHYKVCSEDLESRWKWSYQADRIRATTTKSVAKTTTNKTDSKSSKAAAKPPLKKQKRSFSNSITSSDDEGHDGKEGKQMPVLNAKVRKPEKAKKGDERIQVKIPHPIEDIVDAWALVDVHLWKTYQIPIGVPQSENQDSDSPSVS